MCKSIFISLCISWLVSNSFAAKAPFIQKCVWNDRACLIKSTQIAIPKFGAGIPELGLTPLDPLTIEKVLLDQDGLKVQFTSMTITGLKDARVIDMERNINEQWLKLTLEAPINVESKYEASGNFYGVPIVGDGRFHLQSGKLRVSVNIGFTYGDGKDGEKHFKLGDHQFTYELIEKTLLDFHNLYGGDQEKAAPILTILDQEWKKVVQTYAKPIVEAVVNEIIAHVNKFTAEVPVSELEKNE